MNRLLLMGASALLLTMAACDPVPGRQLTAEEKQADMMWIYSKFGTNYAPLEYKQQLFGFDYQSFKADYLARAAETKDNDEFYALVNEFVATFKDAHTSPSFTPSYRRGREKVAYLGFYGHRQGDNYYVSDLLPSSKGGAETFPVPVGSIITKIDGVPLKEYILKNSTKYADLGRDDANFTFHASRLFTHVSVYGPLPKEPNITLTLKVGEKEKDVTLPWIVRSLDTFVEDQDRYKAQQGTADNSPKKPSDEEKDKDKDKDKDKEEKVTQLTKETFVQLYLKDSESGISKPLFLKSFDGSAFEIRAFADASVKTFRERFSSARILNTIETWSFQKPASVAFNKALADAKDDKKKPTSSDAAKEFLKENRNIPDGAVLVPEATVFPAYIMPTEVDSKIYYIGYIYLHTFSTDPESAKTSFKKTLAAFQKFGVKDIIIDTINNGGGYLTLLMDLSQALSNKDIVMPKMQFGTNEGWVNSLEDMELAGSHDAEREFGRRLHKDLLGYRNQGLRISPKESAYSFSDLYVYYTKPNEDLKNPFNVVLLVNEMCASSCDIFAGVLQDNKMATLIGANTMGAGGNVVQYMQAPNSNLDLSQTESLVIRSNGEYIENLGVKPDIEMVVSESRSSKYDAVRTKAVEELTKKYKAPVVPAEGPTSIADIR